MLWNGLTEKEVEKNRKQYGANTITKIKQKGFIGLMIESLGDPIIKILLIALAIKIVFLFKDFDWFETLGILIAIFLSSFISTISEYGSEEAFKNLQEESKKIYVKVMRNNKVVEVPLEDIVVNDLVLLSPGDAVPADGYLIKGNIRVDESKLNGESKEINKEEQSTVLRGSVVYDGQAKMIVTKVGDKTIYGSLAKEVQEQEPISPLKLRLRGLAQTISKIGYLGAVLVTLSYLFSVIVINNNFQITEIINTIKDVHQMLDYLIYALTLAVTIIVVAVPEGLPMMITLVLSSNMKKMLKENVLVRKLIGIETTGSLNILFTDKTGTLTKGKPEVINITSGQLDSFSKIEDLKKYPSYAHKVILNILYNNESIFSDNKIIGGNTTDQALLKFLDKNEKYQVKVLNKTPFSSTIKYSSATIKENNETTIFIKGASEKIIPNCTKMLTKNGEEKLFISKKGILSEIENLTKRGTRVIALAYKKNETMVFLGYVAIKDELRSEAKEGVQKIKNAGISVVMITGDSKETATSIAKEVGIITSNKDIILSSDELNSYSDEELSKMLPNIKVISRALPKDKSKLVNLAIKNNFVVGMTGDGVNDAPALKKANVGFAMGSGTIVAKEASDIVILDDNIASISKAILYGRTIFKSIRKFIIYQLTCNFCALFLSIIGPFIGVNTPITIIQMLWINMIMDTFAGLAFSFEPALEETMLDKPKAKDEPIMNKYMLSQIIWMGLYSALLCIFFLKSPIIRNYIRFDSDLKYLMTAYFALFIFIGLGNAFNARTYRLNLFANICKNKVFIITILFISTVQIFLIYKGGELFRTFGLTSKELLLVIILSLSVIPIDFIRKLFLKKKGIKLGV